MYASENVLFAESKKVILSIALASTFMFPTIIPSLPVYADAPPQNNEAETFKVLKVNHTLRTLSAAVRPQTPVRARRYAGCTVTAHQD
jgi:hypothetical protein